jgi:hypothetical protein
MIIAIISAVVLTLSGCESEPEYSTTTMNYLGFFDVEDGDFKSAILDEIEFAKALNNETENARGHEIRMNERFDSLEEQEWQQYLYSENKLTEMTEFYFPTVEIDEYEFYGVLMSPAAFGFRYAPLNPLYNRVIPIPG